MLDLRDLIRHPENYLVDGKPLLSAKLELQTLDGSVFVHRYDHGLQEQRITRAHGQAALHAAQPGDPAPREVQLGREALGRIVRDEWMRWAREQPNPKASWLQTWEELTEPEREVDRRIGIAILNWVRLVDATKFPRPCARLHITPTDEWPDVQVEILDGSQLPESGTIDLFAATDGVMASSEAPSCPDMPDPDYDGIAYTADTVNDYGGRCFRAGQAAAGVALRRAPDGRVLGKCIAHPCETCLQPEVCYPAKAAAGVDSCRAAGEDRSGWKSAAIAWMVCSSLHSEYAKGRDPLFTTRQADFARKAEEARAHALGVRVDADPIGIYWKGERILTTARLIEIVKEECSAAWDDGHAAGVQDRVASPSGTSNANVGKSTPDCPPAPTISSGETK